MATNPKNERGAVQVPYLSKKGERINKQSWDEFLRHQTNLRDINETIREQQLKDKPSNRKEEEDDEEDDRIHGHGYKLLTG